MPWETRTALSQLMRLIKQHFMSCRASNCIVFDEIPYKVSSSSILCEAMDYKLCSISSNQLLSLIWSSVFVSFLCCIIWYLWWNVYLFLVFVCNLMMSMTPDRPSLPLKMISTIELTAQTQYTVQRKITMKGNSIK